MAAKLKAPAQPAPETQGASTGGVLLMVALLAGAAYAGIKVVGLAFKK